MNLKDKILEVLNDRSMMEHEMLSAIRDLVADPADRTKETRSLIVAPNCVHKLFRLTDFRELEEIVIDNIIVDGHSLGAMVPVTFNSVTNASGIHTQRITVQTLKYGQIAVRVSVGLQRGIVNVKVERTPATVVNNYLGLDSTQDVSEVPVSALLKITGFR
ncbi:hypothetical protein TOTORO_01720 [Serratia phage vB_SmaS-Totoro]|nr:hypothetical protein TOTORO_01720 [Serratia phage vB_SmaS-Totoro]